MNESNFRCGVVIPCAENRLDNLRRVLEELERQIFKPEKIVVVCDGWDISVDAASIIDQAEGNVHFVAMPKHEPGAVQPKNVGVRTLQMIGNPKCNHVWFLDSDILPLPNTLAEYHNAYLHCPAYDRVMIGPYEWMSKGNRKPEIGLKNDPRWDLFDRHSYRTTFWNDLGVAMANFGGNIVWPISPFKRVGGFWNDLYAGRCEDGELGIRASAMGVPMALVPDARCFHMWHPFNTGEKERRNKRDVPMINERHPYVEDEGYIMVDIDGTRFNYQCKCGASVNTLEMWEHDEHCVRS